MAAQMDILKRIKSIKVEAEQKTNQRRDNKKTPIYDRIEQQKLLSHIRSTLGETEALFWEVSVLTGWRTVDVIELEYSNVNFETGEVTICVNKQTRAAQTRAANKTLSAWWQKLKRRARMTDPDLYIRIDEAGHKAIEQFLNDDELKQLEADLIEAINNAPVKVDTKYLPKRILEQLAKRKENNIFDDFVFSRRITNSNRAKNIDGVISRQTMWKKFVSVFEWFTAEVNAQLKLSIYSSRKTFAYTLLKGKSGKENNISEVMELFSHSSINMTMKYLMLESKAQELQRSFADGWV